MYSYELQNVSYIVDHEMHDGLGHEVPYGLVDDGHVGIHKVPDGLHLPLELRIHRVHEAIRAALLTGVTLMKTCMQMTFTEKNNKQRTTH